MESVQGPSSVCGSYMYRPGGCRLPDRKGMNARDRMKEMWYWIFLWALFSSLFVHGAAGVLMFVMLQRHRHGRVISVIAVSIGFLASVTGAMITSAAVAGIYRVAGKNMAPLEALVWGVGQTVLTLIISFSRILATL
ncbi:transmembrane protein 170B [Rhinolophus ferrumequinum]|uniref:Transmembrane protein 170B n=1 Tax=Rhinolophus ferrumequinum TaxID=59479 RepID=A0A7J7X820_RHIFE|nr:transmembrane protein 170B [Rhinolophus ferrumequinum]